MLKLQPQFICRQGRKAFRKPGRISFEVSTTTHRPVLPPAVTLSLASREHSLLPARCPRDTDNCTRRSCPMAVDLCRGEWGIVPGQGLLPQVLLTFLSSPRVWIWADAENPLAFRLYLCRSVRTIMFPPPCDTYGETEAHPAHLKFPESSGDEQQLLKWS